MFLTDIVVFAGTHWLFVGTVLVGLAFYVSNWYWYFYRHLLAVYWYSAGRTGVYVSNRYWYFYRHLLAVCWYCAGRTGVYVSNRYWHICRHILAVCWDSVGRTGVYVSNRYCNVYRHILAVCWDSAGRTDVYVSNRYWYVSRYLLAVCWYSAGRIGVYVSNSTRNSRQKVGRSRGIVFKTSMFLWGWARQCEVQIFIIIGTSFIAICDITSKGYQGILSGVKKRG